MSPVSRPGHHGGVLELRRIGPDDWAMWRAVRLAALAEAPDAFGSRLADWTDAPEQRWRERLTGDWHNLVAVLDGAPVGMASGLLPAEGPVHVHSMWVAPSARGHGVGDALIDTIVAWAAEQRPGPVILSVRTANTAAIALYERHGFVDAGPEPPDPDGAPERRMVRG